jgi:site-specific recombinase XerD
VDLLFATGIRVGEASALNIDDFDITELVFPVKGKGGGTGSLMLSTLKQSAFNCNIDKLAQG